MPFKPDFNMIVHKVRGVHISVLSIRGGHLIPGTAGLGDYLHGQVFL
jgi:hypothetical protein